MIVHVLKTPMVNVTPKSFLKAHLDSVACSLSVKPVPLGKEVIVPIRQLSNPFQLICVKDSV
jgi:hypothetical protein